MIRIGIDSPRYDRIESPFEKHARTRPKTLSIGTPRTQRSSQDASESVASLGSESGAMSRSRRCPPLPELVPTCEPKRPRLPPEIPASPLSNEGCRFRIIYATHLHYLIINAYIVGYISYEYPTDSRRFSIRVKRNSGPSRLMRCRPSRAPMFLELSGILRESIHFFVPVSYPFRPDPRPRSIQKSIPDS